MTDLLHILLGVDPAPWAEGGSWRLEWLHAPSGDLALLLLAGIALGGVLIAWLYRRESRSLSRPARLGLTALRLAAALVLLAMLLQPALVFTRQESSPSLLLVLEDRSESMDLRDAYTDAGQAQRLAQLAGLGDDPGQVQQRTRGQLAAAILDAGLLDRLGANGDREVQRWPFAARLLPVTGTNHPDRDEPPSRSGPGDAEPAAGETPPAARPPLPDRSSTAVGSSIRQALLAARGRSLAGILLVSDGRSNAGEPLIDVARLAAAEGVTVVALACGTPQGPRNAAVRRLDAPPVMFVRDPQRIDVVVQARGMTGAAAAVLLESRRDAGAWEEVGRQGLTLGENDRVQTVSFDISQPQPCNLELRATLVDAGPELSGEDNVAQASLRVVNQRLRVLFIAGTPFPEVQFLRNALLRDRGVDMSSWLQSADRDYVHPGTTPIQRLPQTQEELDAYDCVLLYDPDPRQWPSDFNVMLNRFVARAGGGLIYIAGERNTARLFDSPEESDLPLLSILPVLREAGLFRTEVSARLSSREAWRLAVTAEGKADPLFRFADNTEDNERALASLPGMFWHFPVTRAKASAVVLARHGDPRMRNEHGQEVLLASHLVGPGRVIFVGFDSTYRWRYLSEQHFDGFWARMVDRAGRGKQLGGHYPLALSVDRETYRPGSQATLVARYDNPAEAPPGIESLPAEVERAGDDQPQSLILEARPGEAGVFEAVVPLPRAGAYTARVWTGSSERAPAGDAPRPAIVQWQVEALSLEMEEPGLDRAALESLARVTEGRVIDLDRADEAANAFVTTRVSYTLEDRQPIWHAPLFWLTFVGLLVAEWIGRKRWGLV